MSSKFVRFGAAVLLLLGAVGYAIASRSEVTPPPRVAEPPIPSVIEVVANTSDAPIARVRLRVRAHMPPAFDDGQPDRRFTGRGVVHQGRGIAGVYFEVGDVPNTAGYFGHVDPELTVVYAGERFVASFPELADLLSGQTDWMSYKLSALSHPKLIRLGIGQLREIALSDPRLAVALLAGSSSEFAEVQPSPGAVVVSNRFETTVDVSDAATATPEMRSILEDMLALGISTIDVEVDVDADKRVGRLAYALRYPPKPGSRPVRLNVEMLFPKYGVRPGLAEPRPATVVTIEDYLSL